jgi:hypothetical protein
MSLSPTVLYNAVYSDVCPHLLLNESRSAYEVPGVSYKQVAADALLRSLLKKWEYENTSKADLSAKEKFLAFNKRCKDWSLQLDWWKDELLFEYFLQEVDNFLHPGGRLLFDSFYYILEAGRTGPGSSIGARGQSMYAKLFSSPLSATSEDLYLMYRTYIRLFPEWSNAEIIRYENYGRPVYVNSSRSSFVPKSQDISRMICTEPNLNMFFQLGLGNLIEGRLSRYFNLDLTTQPEINQRLARQGSRNGQFSTIDLSSASDSISLGMCKRVFPSWFYQTLLEIRSTHTHLDGDVVALDMVSTMGNGFTFPLQTFIFSCLIRAAYRSCGLHVDDKGTKNWGCFGDDLIVDKRAYHSTVRLLSILGFSVNSSKTFPEGHFKESCGADWFHGQPVRGVYIRKLSTPQDIFVAINLLNDWTSLTGISLETGIHYLYTGLSRNERKFLVPFMENNDSGIRVPSSLLQDIRRDPNSSYIYRVFRSVPSVIRIGDGSISVPRRHKSLIYSPSGLLIAYLRGEIKNGMITVRQNRTLYRSKRRCTPNWDYLPAITSRNGCEVEWMRWETASWCNLYGCTTTPA